ncbi:MAG: DUF1549 domain-containing protein, partial [Planctomycetales bacterium]
ETGSAAVPKHPEKSLLVSAIRREGDVQMPPKKPLTKREVDALVHWIRLGAPWPSSTTLKPVSKDAPHWAFQPVQPPSVPKINSDWIRSPIDAFVLARLQENKLAPSPAADRRTMIRRASFDLHGLPPSQEEVERFVRNDAEDAHERLIDRLLKSPRHGERWGRHWLDVARYSDAKGYVYAREERFWVHAWAYRDWVVKAVNDDLPYNRFLLLQVAADQVDAPRGDLAAMGFLTIGRRFLGVTHDVIDDRLDVVTRGTMALTVSCARCHDHKYDPIPTQDYYSLYGVFRNSVERLAPLVEDADKETPFAKGLRTRVAKLESVMSQRRSQAAARVRSRVADYLVAQRELHKYPEEGFDQILVAGDLMPAFVRRWRDYLVLA